MKLHSKVTAGFHEISVRCAKKDNKSQRPAGALTRQREEKSLLEVLSIHYAGTHGTRMLRRHIIYLFKLYDIYLETPFLFYARCDRRRTAIYSELCRAASLSVLAKGAKTKHTLDSSVNFIIRSLKCVELGVPVCVRNLPPLWGKTFRIHSILAKWKKSTTCEISFPRRALNSNDAAARRAITHMTMLCAKEVLLDILRVSGNKLLIIDSPNWFRIDWLDFFSLFHSESLMWNLSLNPWHACSLFECYQWVDSSERGQII